MGEQKMEQSKKIAANWGDMAQTSEHPMVAIALEDAAGNTVMVPIRNVMAALAENIEHNMARIWREEPKVRQ